MIRAKEDKRQLDMGCNNIRQHKQGHKTTCTGIETQIMDFFNIRQQ